MQSFKIHTNEEILRRAYVTYNSRDSTGLLAMVSDDVDWPNGNTRLHGRGNSARTGLANG